MVAFATAAWLAPSIWKVVRLDLDQPCRDFASTGRLFIDRHAKRLDARPRWLALTELPLPHIYLLIAREDERSLSPRATRCFGLSAAHSHLVVAHRHSKCRLPVAPTICQAAALQEPQSANCLNIPATRPAVSHLPACPTPYWLDQPSRHSPLVASHHGGYTPQTFSIKAASPHEPIVTEMKPITILRRRAKQGGQGCPGPQATIAFLGSDLTSQRTSLTPSKKLDLEAELAGLLVEVADEAVFVVLFVGLLFALEISFAELQEATDHACNLVSGGGAGLWSAQPGF